MYNTQIVSFFQNGVYLYADYTSGIFFPPNKFEPTEHIFISKPPRKDWMEYVSNHTFEIYTGIDWKPITILSVVETLESEDGTRSIPVFKIQCENDLKGYRQISLSRILHKSKSYTKFLDVIEKEDECAITMFSTV